jgi:hypothetical protein
MKDNVNRRKATCMRREEDILKYARMRSTITSLTIALLITIIITLAWPTETNIPKLSYECSTNTG